jgi:Na+-translocating ferredoxin:NAD+ oxidoreductase RnfD subunit
MSHPAVPLEKTQENLLHQAETTHERWIMGVAMTAAVLAVLAAITALQAEHHATEAMIDQIRSSELWNSYQAKSIKADQLSTRMEILAANPRRRADPHDRDKLNEYQTDQEKIKKQAEEKQAACEAHLRQHAVFARGVTMFQVAIAVGALSILTRRKVLWLVCLGFGLVGVGFFAQALP